MHFFSIFLSRALIKRFKKAEQARLVPKWDAKGEILVDDLSVMEEVQNLQEKALVG